MKNFEELENLIKTNPDWRNVIKPVMKSIYPVEGKNWTVLMYNLFDTAASANEDPLFKVACESRGTVVDNTTGEIVCAPFTKFWNYGEGHASEIDWASAWYSHKRDGWIYKAFKKDGIVYWMSNGRVATKNDPGAPVDFIPGLPRLNNMSDVLNRALKVSASEPCEAYYNGIYFVSDSDWCKRIPEGATVMFELESPWNKIHTDIVKDAKLWLIGFRMPSGDELTFWDAKERFGIPFETPEVYNFKDDKDMLKTVANWTAADNGEGLVVCDKYFNRVKIKCADYIRLKFESKGEEFGDNRLFRYYLANEVDDLCAANENVKSRVDDMCVNVRKFEAFLEGKKGKVMDILEEYPNKKDFVMFVNKEYDKADASLLVRLYDRDVSEVKEMFFKKWLTDRVGYREMLHMMGMRLTDGNEIDE